MNQPTSHPIPASQGQPASTTPLRDVFQRDNTGVSEDGNYVVLPARVLEGMPLPWQQHFARLITQVQNEHSATAWPYYRVTPCRAATLAELPEEKLWEAGFVHELDDDGNMVHRNRRSGEHVANPEQYYVLVSISDVIDSSFE